MQTDHLTAKGSARLQALCDTAAELFLDLGYDGVSMDALIAQAGGSRRNVMAFGGKAGLFVASVQSQCDALAAPLVALDLSGRLRDALIRLAEALLATALAPRVLALHRLMIAEGQRFPAIAQAIRAAGHDRAVAIVTAFLTSRAAELRPIPAPILAEAFVNLLVTGPQLRALTGVAPSPFPTEIAVDLFLSGALQESRSDA